jgi:rhodanese-related sulfurtransferase
MSEDAFLQVVTEGQPSAPAYFVYNATLNKAQRAVRDTDASIPALTDEQVEEALAAGAILVDAREQQEFAAGHLKGSISIPTDGRLAETVGTVLDPSQRFVILASEKEAQETAVRFHRIGFDHVLGHVADPESYLLAREDRVEHSSRLTVSQIEDICESEHVQLLDIRNIGELAEGTIPGARHLPLAELRTRIGELDPERPVVLYCAGGWRSNVGASVLRAQGFTDVSDVLGGYNAWALTHALAS